MKKLSILIASLLFISFAQAEVWETGVPSLMMDSYGAREMALGDTFTGIADDIDAITVNPAGLNQLNSIEAAFTYIRYPMEADFMHAAGGYPMPKSLLGGYVAADITLFSLAEFGEYDLVGNKTGENLSAGDFLFNIGYANNFLRMLGIDQNLDTGINIKMVNSRLHTESSTALGFDLGLLYKLSVPNMGSKILQDNLGIGFSMQNLGSSLNYGGNDTVLPRNLRIGAGYKGYQDAVHGALLGLDINMPNDSDMIMGIGVEYSFMNMVFGRLGYKLAGRDVDGISLGVGGKYMIAGMRASLDYALTPLGDFGLMNTFTLGIKLGAVKVEESVPEVPEKVEKKAEKIETKEIESELPEETTESIEAVESEMDEMPEEAEEQIEGTTESIEDMPVDDKAEPEMDEMPEE